MLRALYLFLLPIFLLFGLIAAPPALANAGHWRSIGLSQIESAVGGCIPSVPAMAMDDGVYASLSGCDEVNGTGLRFVVSDYASVQDATLSFEARSAAGAVVPTIECVAADGTSIAEIVSANVFTAGGLRRNWDTPSQCFASGEVEFRISGTGTVDLQLDFVALNVKSRFRNAPLIDVDAASGTCGDECDHPMTINDGQFSPWIACAPIYGFGNPTDFVFDTFDFTSASNAHLVLDSNASGVDARARISCVDGSGMELASIVGERFFEAGGEVNSWPVPSACLGEPEAKIRVTRTGSNCVGVDQVRLEVDSASRSHSIASAVSAGTCGGNQGAGCLADLNRDDNRNLASTFCEGTDEYASPTDLIFLTADWAGTSAGTFVLDAIGSGPAAEVRISCLDVGATELAVIEPNALFPQHQSTQAFSIPAGCFTSPRTRIRVERLGAGCLETDFARLYTESISGVPDGFVLNHLALQGYSDVDTVRPGETITLYVHAPLGFFDVELIRYGIEENSLWSESGIAGSAQPYRADAYKDGAGFSPSWSFTIPPDFSSGLYGARLRDGQTVSAVAFVVRDPDVTAAPGLAVMASSNTWETYNHWNGDSLDFKGGYRYFPGDESFRTNANFTSTQRPSAGENPAASSGGHLAGAERWILGWLEREAWGYSMVAASDLEDQSFLQNYETLLISTHSEYWTQNMMDGLEAFLAAGGNVLYLSGNGVYWRTTRSGTQLETQKLGGTHAHDGEPGGLWRSLGQSEHRLVGVGYTGSGYCTSAPYEVLAPNHWLFEGTDVIAGQSIGADGEPGSCGVGASGWETDKTSGETPANHVLLAKGENPGGGGADMLYYETPSGGHVFAAGSINFGRSLVRDDTLSAMLNNALARMGSVKQETIAVESIAAPDGTCLGAGCEAKVLSNDGSRLRWAACAGAHDYGNPTDFEFDLEYRQIRSGRLELTTDASGPNASVEISCLDAAGIPVATLQSERLFPQTLESYSWALDPACFGTDHVRIRIERPQTSSNCLGPDRVALAVESEVPVPEPSLLGGLMIGCAGLSMLLHRRWTGAEGRAVRANA